MAKGFANVYKILTDRNKNIVEDNIQWRNYQSELKEAIVSKEKHIMVSWARRLGKDASVYDEMIKYCLDNSNARILYVFPTSIQGAEAIIDGITDEGTSWTEWLIQDDRDIVKTQTGKLFDYMKKMVFSNGSTIRIVGANNETRLVG